MSDWAMELPVEDAVALGPLRLQRGLEGCQVGNRIWLRGAESDEALARSLRQLPALDRYHVLPDRELLAEGHLVPHGYLPDGPWLPLAELLKLAPPFGGPPGQATGYSEAVESLGACWQPATLILIRDDLVREPNLLLTTAHAWTAYATAAPQLRLNRWSFAVTDRGEVLVRGTPLPPLPGRRFVEADGVALEAGWAWSPRLEPAVLRQKLDLASDDLVLLECAEASSTAIAASVISDAAFVKATRSAVRLTQAGAAP